MTPTESEYSGGASAPAQVFTLLVCAFVALIAIRGFQLRGGLAGDLLSFQSLNFAILPLVWSVLALAALRIRKGWAPRLAAAAVAMPALHFAAPSLLLALFQSSPEPLTTFIASRMTWAPTLACAIAGSWLYASWRARSRASD